MVKGLKALEALFPEKERPVRLSDVAQVDVDWVWPQHLAPGMLTVLEGMPGEGKGLITFDIAARVTRGWEFPPHDDALLPPDQRPVVRDPRSVILVTSEDSRARTEAPRAEAAGADLHLITCIPLPSAAPSPADAVVELLSRVHEHADGAKPPCGLIIIDPLEDAIPGLTVCDASTVRALLRPVIGLSRKLEAALIGVRHLSKSPGSRAVTRGTGSIAISAVARFVFLVARPRLTASAPRVLACSKANVCEPPPSLAFTITSVQLKELQAAACQWLGTSAETAEDPALFANPRRDSAVARAELFLLESLAEGPQPIKEILDQASLAGLAQASVWRAKQSLHIKSVHKNLPERKWFWKLPEQAAAPAEDAVPTRKTMSDRTDCAIFSCLKQARPGSPYCEDHQQ